MKKKVSIIVPVYNTEKYLRTCLDSLVNQTLKDIEIVIVNDGSIDNSESIIKEYQNKYKDMIIYKKQDNSGVAVARNTALTLASGEYVGFVDSDDFVAVDMYEKLYNSAKANDADIVVSGYFFDYDAKNIKNFELGNTELYGKSLIESPEMLINTTPFITNKIIKNSLIKDNGFVFEKYRIFEDLLFTYKAMLKANKINKVDECFYHYCRRTGESVTGTFSPKFEDIFKVGNELRSFYIENNGNDLIDYVDYIIIKHIYLRFNARVGIKEMKHKHVFARKSMRYLNKNVPNWKKNKYIITNRKPTNGFMVIVNPYLLSAKRMLNKIKRKATSFGSIYRKKYNSKINNKIIYLYSQKGNDINGNMFYLLKELRNNREYDDYKIYIPVKENRIEEFKTKIDNYGIKNYKLIKDNTRKSTTILSKAKYIFTDTSMEVFYVKKPGQIYVNTWHGTPLKTLGKSVANDYYTISNVQKNFLLADYLLYPNEYMKDIMIRDYMLDIRNNKICMLGYPRNSIFFKEKPKNNKIKVAYLPTWRGNNLGKDANNYLNELKNILNDLDSSLNEKHDFYINLHPYLKNKIDFDDYKNIKKFPKEYETYDFLSTCDILITDYSSVFYDFACTRRKIILFTYDKEEYLKDRGMYCDINTLPFPQVSTVEELVSEINKPFKFNYQSFIDEYCKYDSKDNAKKLIDLVFKNKTNDIEIITNKKTKEKNILFHSNSFIKMNNIECVDNKIKELSKNNNVYASFLNSKIRNNRAFLKTGNKLYFGYFGYFSLCNLFDLFMLKLLKKKDFLYSIFPHYYKKIFKFECLRRYQNVDFSSIVLYKEKNKLDIYTFAFSNFDKIIYLNPNQKLNFNILNKYDKIYVTSSKEMEELIKKGISKDKIFVEE